MPDLAEYSDVGLSVRRVVLRSFLRRTPKWRKLRRRWYERELRRVDFEIYERLGF